MQDPARNPIRDALATLGLIWTILVLTLGAIAGYAVLVVHFGSGYLSGDGISTFVAKPATWDFTNLWFGGRLALSGETWVLFDLAEYRARLRDLFGQGISDSEWSYPPLALPFAAPFGALPLYPAHALWTALGLGLLAFTCLRLGLPRRVLPLLLIAPGVLVNIVFGQNGAVTASLLTLGLLASASRPAAAGIALGLLGFKPQMGLLAPVALAAAGRWRAFVFSALALLALIAVSVALFGLGPWRGFFTVTQPLMTRILNAPYGQGYHANAMTVFALARSLGAGLGLAYLVQGAVSLAAVFLTFRLWRAPVRDAGLRVAAMGPLALLATPYGFTYDLVIVTLTTLVLYARAGHRFGPLLGLIWLWPLYVSFYSANTYPLTPFVLAALVVLCLREIARSEGTGAWRLVVGGLARK